MSEDEQAQSMCTCSKCFDHTPRVCTFNCWDETEKLLLPFFFEVSGTCLHIKRLAYAHIDGMRRTYGALVCVGCHQQI